jgi:hypothetical protein
LIKRPWIFAAFQSKVKKKKKKKVKKWSENNVPISKKRKKKSVENVHLSIDAAPVDGVASRVPIRIVNNSRRICRICAPVIFAGKKRRKVVQNFGQVDFFCSAHFVILKIDKLQFRKNRRNL